MGMAVALVTSVSPALSDPGDIFALAAPAVEDGPPTAAPTMAGDSSVSANGSLEYAYPIEVPPGRNGMQPHLGLRYSSQAPIYGGIAAGWSLDIPIITLDTTHSQLRGGGGTYRTTMGGGQDLVQVSEATPIGALAAFRGRHDASFTRYQFMHPGYGFAWRAYTTDGIVHTFGDTDHVTCTNVSTAYAPLTKSSDAFGNLVEYYYATGADGECRIQTIIWGQNTAASIGTFAGVDFTYNASPAACGGAQVGSQTSYRSGTKIVTGASELDTIVAWIPGDHGTRAYQRQYTLAYAPETSSCTTAYGAYRRLESIQESAWGASGNDVPRVDLPKVTFGYGSATLNYSFRIPTSPGWSDGASEDASGFGDLSLGWGLRVRDQQPTVEAMMIDIDGDGLVDRLTNEPLPSITTQTSCGASWQRNLGNGSFGPHQHIALPTVKWETKSTQPNFSGGPYAGSAHNKLPQQGPERCALNHQLSTYQNSHSGSAPCLGGTCLPAGSSVGYCSLTQVDCIFQPSAPSVTTTALAYRWIDIDGDGLVDLVASPSNASSGLYNLIQGDNSGAPVEPPIFGAYPPCPARSLSGGYLNHYSMCDGMYPWFVYKNHGNGVFGIANFGSPLPDRILYQALPLETSAGDSSIVSLPVGETEGVTDLDGDGSPDGVFSSPYAPSGTWWSYLNDGTGQMFGTVAHSAFVFSTPAFADLNVTDLVPIGGGPPIQIEGLLDLNGDGLADHWVSSDNGQSALMGFNAGTGFLAPTPVQPRPGNDFISRTDAAVPDGPPQGKTFITAGIRQDVVRTLDFDGDGRVDVFHITQSMSGPTCPAPIAGSVSFNEGGVFGGAPSMAAAVVPSMAHTIAVDDQYATWQIRADMIDLNGDGIPEAVDFGCDRRFPGQMATSSASVGSTPPRLLTSIANGRGATTSVQYASTTNHAVVEQHPELGKTMPHVRWVVQSIATADAFASTTTTTSYYYKNPRFLPDDKHQYVMRGFDEIDTTLPSGAISVSTFDYDLDWSGRVFQTYIRPAPSESATDVRSIDTTIWDVRPLFNGSVTTFHPLVNEHVVCKNGQSLSTCTPTTAAAYTRTTTFLTACASTMSGGTCDSSTQPNASSLLWLETKSLLQSGWAPADGDRAADTAFAVWADASTYRIRRLRTSNSIQTAGAFAVYARSGHDWNTDTGTAYSVPLTDLVWFDNTSSTCTTTTPTCAVTKHVYDMTTGNATEHWKPVQNSASTTRRVLTYDTRKLFPVIEVDEKGLERDFTYEYGTGATLTTSGPNVRTCTSNCPTDALHPTKETRMTRVDGLGRPIERWETTSDDGNVYTLIQTGTTTYVDRLVTPNTPTSVTTQDLIVTENAAQTKTMTEVDGHGRPLRKTTFVQGSAPADAITTFHFRNDGTLSSVSVPDPTVNDASTVTYTYAFDSLGRPTSIRRPDSTVVASQSGVDVSYDGITKTTTEVVGAGGGNAARTQTKTDSFGRLVEVDERIALGPDTFATTRYTYDAADNVATIVDPENVTTTLTHDFAGRRTLITRGGRNWKYTYDKNGNLVAEQVPGSPNPPTTDIDYTTTIAYDDDDRMTSRVIGKRNMTAADQALFGVDHETFTWDYVGGNRKDHLIFWIAYPPGSTTATNSATYSYDGRGLREITQQAFNTAGYANLTREVYEYKSLGGAPWKTTYWDNVGGSNTTSSHVYFDNRGLPQKITLSRTGLPNQDVGVQTRNVAGLVTKRRTDLTGAMPFVESNWTYDKLGRVTSQVVQKGPGPTQVARQDLVYFGNDDPTTMDHWLGATNHKQFHYTYDQRHQLTNVSESAQGGVFAAQYTFGNAGRFKTAMESAAPLPGSDVKPRNVVYHYGDTDPERITSLTNTSNGTTYASYAYDAAGNQNSRAYPATGESWDFLYDGVDRLRRATKKLNSVVQGTEEYWYDGEGHRTHIVKRDAGGNKTELVWFIADTEAHYDGTGTLQHAYSHVSMGTPVARVDRSSDANTSLEFQFHGLANNTLTAVDQGGTINASFSYAPFGEIVEATDAGSGSGAGVLAHRRRMNDKYKDELSGLTSYGARFFDQTLISWTQGDPVFRFVPEHAATQPRRHNLYAFSLNNALRYMDPDGRSPDPTIVGQMIGAALNGDYDVAAALWHAADATDIVAMHD